MRVSALLRTILAIQSLVVRGFHFDDPGLVADVAPYRMSIRCGECGGKARRVKDRRVHCDARGTVKTEQVQWAAHDSHFTHAFEERTACLAQ